MEAATPVDEGHEGLDGALLNDNMDAQDDKTSACTAEYDGLFLFAS